MSGAEREFAFDIDTKKWFRSRKPSKKADDRNKASAKEVGCFSQTDGKILSYSRENLLDFNKPEPNTTLREHDYLEFRKQNEN